MSARRWHGPTARGSYPDWPPLVSAAGALLPLYLLVAGAAPRALLAAALCVALANPAIRFAIVRLPHASP